MRAPSQGDFVEGLVVGALGTLVLGVTPTPRKAR